MMNERIKNLWEEKKKYDMHPENHVLQTREWECIARLILEISKETATTLTAEDMEAVNWAKARLGVA